MHGMCGLSRDTPPVTVRAHSGVQLIPLKHDEFGEPNDGWCDIELDQIQYTRFQMTSSEVVHGGLGQQNCHRRRGWVPRTQARADGCGRHLDRGERLNAALTMN